MYWTDIASLHKYGIVANSLEMISLSSLLSYYFRFFLCGPKGKIKGWFGLTSHFDYLFVFNHFFLSLLVLHHIFVDDCFVSTRSIRKI